jgi:hypothetical protein
LLANRIVIAYNIHYSRYTSIINVVIGLVGREGAGAEAGAINRPFRASTWIMLKTMAWPSGDVRSLMTWVLRRTAQDRLLESGAPAAATETVLDSEPTLGDSWLAYFVLAPGSVLEDVLSLI